MAMKVLEGDYPYIYAWGNNPKRVALKGRRCKMTQRLALNSAVVEFENGQREVVSRNALRQFKEPQYTGQPPHRWVKCCSKCGSGDLSYWWDGTTQHSGQEFCNKCKEWVIPGKRREFI